MGMFHGTVALKKNPYGKPKSPAQTVGVLGAGLMGAGIAQVSASKGHNVLLKDINAGAVARGIGQIEGNLNQKLKRRRMTVFQRDETLSRVFGTTTTVTGSNTSPTVILSSRRCRGDGYQAQGCERI